MDTITHDKHNCNISFNACEDICSKMRNIYVTQRMFWGRKDNMNFHYVAHNVGANPHPLRCFFTSEDLLLQNHLLWQKQERLEGLNWENPQTKPTRFSSKLLPSSNSLWNVIRNTDVLYKIFSFKTNLFYQTIVWIGPVYIEPEICSCSIVLTILCLLYS